MDAGLHVWLVCFRSCSNFARSFPATGRVDIQHVAHRNEIQVCERDTLTHLLPQSHELIQNKDHLSQLSFCHTDPRFPVQEGGPFAVCTCDAARHDQKDQIRGCQMQLEFSFNAANSARLSNELTFMLSAHTKQK